MWQSAHERPLPPRPWSRRSRKPMSPRATETQFSPPHCSVESWLRIFETASSSGSPADAVLAPKADTLAITARQTFLALFMASFPVARVVLVVTLQDAVARPFVPLGLSA